MTTIVTLDDYESHIGRPLTGDEADTVLLMLEFASALARTHAGWLLTRTVGDTVTLDAEGGTLLFLPSLHVETVTTIVLDGTSLAADTYEWSAIGMLRRTAGWGTKLRSVAVTYTHGWALDAHQLGPVRTVILQAVRRGVSNPEARTAVALGSYSEARSASEPGQMFWPQELRLLDRVSLPGRP